MVGREGSIKKSRRVRLLDSWYRPRQVRAGTKSGNEEPGPTEVSIRIFKIYIVMYRAPGIGDKPYALQGTPKTKDTHERVLQDVRSKTELYWRRNSICPPFYNTPPAPREGYGPTHPRLLLKVTPSQYVSGFPSILRCLEATGRSWRVLLQPCRPTVTRITFSPGNIPIMERTFWTQFAAVPSSSST